jgi:hypothetical protein
MEAIRSSETSVDTQRTTRRYIPEADTLHNHRCENLKSCMMFVKILIQSYGLGSLIFSNLELIYANMYPIDNSRVSLDRYWPITVLPTRESTERRGHTSESRVTFEPTIPVFEGSKTTRIRL